MPRRVNSWRIPELYSKVPGWVRCCRRRSRRHKGGTAIGRGEHTPTLKIPHPISGRHRGRGTGDGGFV